MRLETAVVLAAPLLAILLTQIVAAEAGQDAATGSYRRPGGETLASHRTDGCPAPGEEEDEVWDRGSERGPGGDQCRGERTAGRAGERRRERGKGENEDTVRRIEEKDAKEGKRRKDKKLKGIESGGERGKERDEKTGRTDKQKKRESKEKEKQHDGKTRRDVDSNFHKKDKKKRDDKYEKRLKHKKDESNKNNKHKDGHKYHEEHKKNKNKKHKENDKHPKKYNDKSGRDKREREKDRKDDMTPANHKKQGINYKSNEKPNIGQKVKDKVPHKTSEVAEDSRRENLTTSVPEEHGRDAPEEVAGDNVAKEIPDDLSVGMEDIDDRDTDSEENMTLGEQEEDGSSVDDGGDAGEDKDPVGDMDGGGGNGGGLEGLGGYVQPFGRVTFGDGLFVDLEFDSMELPEEERVGKAEPESQEATTDSEAKVAETPGQKETDSEARVSETPDQEETGSEAKVSETPDQEGTTDGKYDQKTGEEEGEIEEKEEGTSRSARAEEIELDGREEGQTYETGEREECEVGVGDPRGQRDADEGLPLSPEAGASLTQEEPGGGGSCGRETPAH